VAAELHLPYAALSVPSLELRGRVSASAISVAEAAMDGRDRCGDKAGVRADQRGPLPLGANAIPVFESWLPARATVRVGRRLNPGLAPNAIDAGEGAVFLSL
jgi:hypothetical protein